jgi:DNA-directed RNA polymerase specialized sigma24 family protein
VSTIFAGSPRSEQDARRGRQDRLAAVFAAHHAGVERYVRSLLSGRDKRLAEDLSQEVFLLLVRDYSGLPLEHGAMELLRKVARTVVNAHYKAVRKAGGREDAVDFADVSRELLPTVAAAEEEALASVTVLAELAGRRSEAVLEVAAA